MAPSKKRILKQTRIQPIDSHERQQLEQLEERMSVNVDNFLALSERSDPTQIALAHQQAKNEFSTIGPEMHRIAEKIGGEFPLIVDEFLASVDTVLHGQAVFDEEKITDCLYTQARLKAQLKNLTSQKTFAANRRKRGF